MKTTSHLLVLKESSKQVAHHTQAGGEVDRRNIANHANQINEFLHTHQDWGVVLVCSAARKLLGRDGWPEITQEWATHLQRSIWTGQFTEESLLAGGVRHILDTARSGSIAIINGHDTHLHRDSRLRNNDFLAADVAGSAALSGLFETVELGKFTNVAGVMDYGSVVSEVNDIQAIRHLAYDAADHSTTGGMTTKLDAAEQALAQGVDKVWLADGHTHNALMSAHLGTIGTTFVRMNAGNVPFCTSSAIA